ncbi:uncharacterized protein LOC133191974 [Saccostrea echinata]|uniref:uncharacterized protein LOC133191974 n=1 Tax=Saccostrea echinata TaxID=191078 RepID=UPI002A8146BE|nr:uncharacterized protein LOC133191974 [Saccostrea echinata]
MTLKIAVILFMVILTKVNTETEENSAAEKRLLLDDPQTVTAQMLSLQREIQTLQTKIAEIDVHQSQIQLMNAQISQLQQENAALKLQISQGTSTQHVQTLTNKVTSLEANLTIMSHDLPLLRTQVNAMVADNHNTEQHSGSTYFPIWGRKSCPAINGTKILYTGITAGKYYSSSGSGTNTLCVPHNPDSLSSDFPTTTYSSYNAELFGAEYQFTYKNVAVDDDVPCAICQVKSATATMMVPAKLSCPKEWTLQYHGYLSSNYYGGKGTEYICVDSEPEYFEGLRQVNNDGLDLYPVHARCGSLPCPPYKEGQEVACAICTI